ncbi:xylulokinase [Thalassospira xiamenensis]|jgi:xylulokinase|uniref:Xylulose kinase n=1 Tax=Thalassospira xiamenensis TaxID=220697 RepID=A0A367XBM8_9PROT|nr:xylulokinase [Thalassospira xiamenensis]KZB55897.1 xylulose kinase [Thalassospira xiamenensis]MCK2169266.1 xylulokinase [Thalassospira xiamenensis]RCK50082.1 xylulose kinase [Thalassospira xiamenensis]
MTFLGIDLGTSGIRLLLIDDDGVPIGSAERSYHARHPHPGWSEQNPSDWIAALEDSIAELRDNYPQFAALRGIGVAGHMHGATLLDRSGQVLRPCILWNDTRSHTQAARLDAKEPFRAISGNIVFPGFTAPKLEWVRENEPDIFAKTAKVLLPAAYLNYYLTGEYVADMSDSAGTSWLDLANRKWSSTLLDAGNMRDDQMPRLVEGTDEAGRLRPALLDKWGLGGPVSVAGGAGDNAAAACGIGAQNEGQGFVSLGTSGVLLSARDGYHPAPETALHTFCHAIPGRWYQMGVMLSATDSLNWLARITGQKPTELTAKLDGNLRKPGTVHYLPYLAGERTPHNDAEIRGSFTGLATETDREDLTRAVLEGVAFGLRDSFEALTATNARLKQLIAIGGGSASRYWIELIATVLGVPLALPKSGEFGAALGAARLGIAAATGATADRIMSIPEVHETIDPNESLRSAFDVAYQNFRKAYPLIKACQQHS